MPASRPWTELELDEIERVWGAGDAPALEKIGAALGVRFSLDGMSQLRSRCIRITPRDVLIAMSEAMASEAGIGVRERHELMSAAICLAAVGSGRLVVAVGRARNKGVGVADMWPTLRPWFRELARNRPRIDAWLDAANADRIEFAVTAQPPVKPAQDETRGLIDAIVEAPDDDAPRLVLADLLQQRGAPHGELIALQCQTGPFDDTTREREQRLLADHGAWIAGTVAERASKYQIARGFVDTVTMDASSFSAHGDTLFSDHPIRELTLRPVNERALAKLASTPALARVRSLNLEQEIGKERSLAIAALLASPHFTRLEKLRFSHWHGSDWKKAFARMSAPAFVELEIYAGDFDLRALVEVLTSPRLPRLARLDLTGGMFSERFIHPTAAQADAIAEALANQTRLRALSLDSDSGGLEPRHWELVFASPGGRALEALACEDDSFDDADVAAIASAKQGGLRSLNVCRSGVHADALEQLLRSPVCARLERLISWSSEVKPLEFLPALERLPASHPLKYVGIGSVDLPARFIDANKTAHPDARRLGWR